MRRDYGKYPKIQILTIKELFDGQKAAIFRLWTPRFFKKAQTEDTTKQGKLL